MTGPRSPISGLFFNQVKSLHGEVNSSFEEYLCSTKDLSDLELPPLQLEIGSRWCCGPVNFQLSVSARVNL